MAYRQLPRVYGCHDICVCLLYTSVVLIDEYDAPLLDSNSDALLQQQLRNEMRKLDVYKRQGFMSEPVYDGTENQGTGQHAQRQESDQ